MQCKKYSGYSLQALSTHSNIFVRVNPAKENTLEWILSLSDSICTEYLGLEERSPKTAEMR